MEGEAEALTRDEVREVDRIAIEELGIPGAVLMENAAAGAARLILAELGPERAGSRAAILCGGGNNGGDGYAIARHLHNAGVEVEVFAIVEPGALKGDARINADVALRMGIPVRALEEQGDIVEAMGAAAAAAVRVDALLGTGFRGELRGKALSLLALLDPIRRGLAVAVDLPSGLDCDSGRACEHTFRADLTATFVAPKVGFASPGAGPYLGRVETVSIGTPPELVRRVRSARGGGSGNTSVRLL